MRRPVAIAGEDARHHLHVVGETGTGKSTLLANLVLQDAAAGRAAVVIDPKGDLVESILERLPEDCEDRTCVVDPDDRKDAVGLNVLAGSDPGPDRRSRRRRVQTDLRAVVGSAHRRSCGPRA